MPASYQNQTQLDYPVGHVLLDTVSYTTKPTGAQVGAIQRRHATTEATPLTLAQLLDHIAAGHTFRLGSYDPTQYTDKGNVQTAAYVPLSTSLMGFDVDNSHGDDVPHLTPDALLSALTELGIHPAALYYTFSHTPQRPKFRFLLLWSSPFLDPEDFKARWNLVATLLEQVLSHNYLDRSCSNVDRLWFTGTLYEGTLHPALLSCSSALATLGAIAPCSPSNERRTYQRVTKGYTVVNRFGTLEPVPLPQHEVLRGGGRITGSAIRSTNSVAHNSSSTKSKTKHRDLGADYEELDKLNLWKPEVRARVPGLDEFYESCHDASRERPHYSDLLFWGTNLQHVRGGLKFLKDCLAERHRLSGDIPDYHHRLLKAIGVGEIPHAQTYQGAGLDGGGYTSPYEALRKTGIKRLTTPTPRPLLQLHEAETKMTDYFLDAITADPGTVTLLRMPTGLGKTQQLMHLGDILAPHEYGTVGIAVPDHALVREVADRLRAAGLPVVTTPPQPVDALSPEDRGRLDYLYAVGAHERASQYLKKLASGNEAVMAYYTAMLDARSNTDSLLVTTHAQALLTSWATDGGQTSLAFATRSTWVFDEDPLPTLIPSDFIPRADFNRLESDLINAGRCPSSLGLVRSMLDRMDSGENAPSALEQFLVPPREVDKVATIVARGGYQSDVVSLFSARAYCVVPDQYGGPAVGVSYSSRRNLPKDKTVVVMSATASPDLYDRLVPNGGLRVHDVGAVELRGKLRQDTSYTYSRSSLNNPTLCGKIRTMLDERGIPSDHIITFKTHKHLLGSTCPMHFGNTAGKDGLKGEPIVVVGMPYPNEASVLLRAHVLGMLVDCPRNALFTSKQTVRYNGYEFQMQTYTYEPLRQVQLWAIDSELTQAIGRARLVREDSGEVLLLAGLPVPQAEQTKLVD